MEVGLVVRERERERERESRLVCAPAEFYKVCMGLFAWLR